MRRAAHVVVAGLLCFLLHLALQVPVMLHQPVSLHVSLQRKVDAILGLFSPHEQKVTFKALKFHFLGFNGMLATRFSVSTCARAPSPPRRAWRACLAG